MNSAMVQADFDTRHSDVFCNSVTEYSRWKTRVVAVGDVPLGGDYPIRVQSMTTTDTMDTAATVAQAIRMIEAGCEYVRITAPSVREARNLENIRTALRAAGFSTPLVADIHFTPNAAEIAARIVEKVRVNPGNYADKKKFETIDYSDAAYEAELERIYERFSPLVAICKEYGTAMRIGTNHGSLSDRILSRYGDTPLGMVESAMEFVRVCEDMGYYDIVLSMKASNTRVMVQAYRLLVATMRARGMSYPLHLGVTEAGDGEDGRIKSAVGIGTLLEDGLGDTVRVSLTEDPELEIPVARTLVERYRKRPGHASIATVNRLPFDMLSFERRHSAGRTNIGGENVPCVVADFSQRERISPAALFPVGYTYSVALDKWNIGDSACDLVYCGAHEVDFEIPGTLGIIYDAALWQHLPERERCYPLFTAEAYQNSTRKSVSLNFVSAQADTLRTDFVQLLAQDPTAVLVLETDNNHAMPALRRAFFQLMEAACPVPVIVRRGFDKLNDEELQLYSAADFGGLLLNGLGDGVWLSTGEDGRQRLCNNTAFGILQAARVRISKTEYISCPSCGRTLFDLQETTARIRKRTDHLKGVKIGIMGCIVNGPGEMADADYGYVGTGPGRITLYRGQNVVSKNIPSEQAVDALIELIRQDGNWIARPDEEGAVQES